MIHLFEVNQKLMEAFDEETGELLIPEEELDEIFQAEKNGLDYFMGLYKDATATAEAYEKEAKALAARADRYTKIAEKAFKTVEKHMGGQAYESAAGKISYRKSEKAEQSDEMAFLTWDKHFTYGKSTFTPDKTAIKKAIKAGEKIPGWSVNTYNNMSIK